ncbi:hypothetical protein B0H17DRAFT_1035189 [Mycena rosella]|uniref:Uncharacterized protein n=1 Tax=Mycena rosella TaxID=1033263 RepID=A0AAD7GV72_MYCRO|nr:hypothetical protein B0H17DRAFT_1035189 [Mycena rosella]
MSDKVREFIEIPQQFVREGSQFLTRCTKPSDKAVGVGFAVMGFIGYFVKLIHIPINNILVYVYSYPVRRRYSFLVQWWGIGCWRFLIACILKLSGILPLLYHRALMNSPARAFR